MSEANFAGAMKNHSSEWFFCLFHTPFQLCYIIYMKKISRSMKVKLFILLGLGFLWIVVVLDIELIAANKVRAVIPFIDVTPTLAPTPSPVISQKLKSNHSTPTPQNSGVTTPTPSPTPKVTPTPTPTPRITPTPAPSILGTNEPLPTPTPEPSL